ncbi:tryptophan halogenase family protein, partial [Allopontixanthobacter sp.]|uniref:tryptophan halogenase family protein n=1 Tax=Allopontixanthobacter sp. TaxID=2906452 RepID=UPI002AB82079
FLRRYAEARGVVRHEGLVIDARLDAEMGDLTGVTLADGRQIDADFFIDCSGFRGLLIAGALETGFDDWSHYLPCDRAMAVSCAGGGDFTPYTKSLARKAGWQWRIPLQHRIGNGHVYSSAFLSDDEAADVLLANLDGAQDGDPRLIPFTTGMRRQHWNRNCLALGLAAGFMEPLESTSIHLVQSAISRFLALLPAGPPEQASIDHFNAQARFEWTRIRDFLVLHYRANCREGEPFWDAMRHVEMPDTLKAKIDQWQANGFIHREHEELFTEVGWFQVLVGQGVTARGYNPMADGLSEQDLCQLLEQTEADLIDEVRVMPRHLEVVDAMVQSAKHPVVAA